MTVSKEEIGSRMNNFDPEYLTRLWKKVERHLEWPGPTKADDFTSGDLKELSWLVWKRREELLKEPEQKSNG